MKLRYVILLVIAIASVSAYLGYQHGLDTMWEWTRPSISEGDQKPVVHLSV